MNGKKLFIIIASSAAALIIALVVILKLTIKPEFVDNPPQTYGNTIGNLYNNGLFCEYGDTIYFSNINDSGKLYAMDSTLKNIRKISEDSAGSINCDGQGVYYIKTNYLNKNHGAVFDFSRTGVCRYGIKKGSLTSISKDGAKGMMLYDNDIFYLNKTADETTIRKMKLDGSDNTIFLEGNKQPFAIFNHKLYYSDMDGYHGIYYTSTDYASEVLTLDANTMMPVVDHGYIYFLNLNEKYTLCRVDLDGNNFERLISERIVTYNIHPNGDIIYYQVDNKNDSMLCSYNLETGKRKVLAMGNYHNINVTRYFVFFTSFEDDLMYMAPFENTSVNVFHPIVDETEIKTK